MRGQQDFANLSSDLPHHRIVEERLVSRGDAQDRDLLSIAFDLIRLKQRDARGLAVPGADLLLGLRRDIGEILWRILGEIVGTGAGKQDFWIDRRIFLLGGCLLHGSQNFGDRVIMRGCHLIPPRCRSYYWTRGEHSAHPGCGH